MARPIERFELAGTLNGHPGHVRSDRAKQNFPAIFSVAVTGYRARDPLRSYSRATADSALLSWAGVYRPTGNPIDEWFFVPLLQAVDLLAWSLPRGEQAALRDWVQAFVTTGDRFYAGKAAGNSARANNWMARRLPVVTTGTPRSATPRGSPPVPACCSGWQGRRSRRSAPGPRASSTHATTPAPSCWLRSTASRSVAAAGRRPAGQGIIGVTL